jgi:hypothetical protein
MRALSTGERVVWATAYALMIQTSHRREHVIDAIRAAGEAVRALRDVDRRRLHGEDRDMFEDMIGDEVEISR